jgi:hypothetical protein
VAMDMVLAARMNSSTSSGDILTRWRWLTPISSPVSLPRA